MLSVTDELLTYINVCSFHWILLIIEVEEGRVLIYDSLSKEEKKYQILLDALQRYFQSLSHYIGLFCSFHEISQLFIFLPGRVWKIFIKKTKGGACFKEELTFVHPDVSNLFNSNFNIILYLA